MEPSLELYLHTTNHTVEWFADQNAQGKLEMRPPFQRNLVWLESQKSYLIDTILNGYPIPEIYLQKFQGEDGRASHAVVDGQQRITACLEFIENRFELSGDRVSPSFQDLTFEDLTTAQKGKVLGYTFVVRLLPTMPEAEIREIFARLNSNNMALNPQELRHARYRGEFAFFIDQMADDPIWGGFGIFTPNDVRRMLDREFISELALGILVGPQNKKLSLDRWYEVYDESFDEKDRLSETFSLVTGEIRQLLPNLRVHRWGKKSDFYTLFLVLASYQHLFPLASEKRDALRNALTRFSDQVNMQIAKSSVEDDSNETIDDDDMSWPRQEDEELPQEVVEYAVAVERAASDLGRRRQRNKAVDKLVRSVLQSKVATSEVVAQALSEQ